MKGLLIVIDGIDGSGKTTQVGLLSDYLIGKNISHEVIAFPQYGENLYADLISQYLEGEFGDILDVNPYLLSLAYAGDRALAKEKIEKWMKEGKIVIANRYVSSSKAHLSANLAEKSRAEFINWVDRLEYEENGMPREDLTIFLDLDPAVGQQNALERDLKDIHEESLTHMQIAAKVYRTLAQTKSWVTINCMSDGKMREAEEIHQELVKVLEGILAKNS